MYPVQYSLSSGGRRELLSEKRNQRYSLLLKTIANGQDDLAVQRIINVPKRGIGATSVGKVTIFASANG